MSTRSLAHLSFAPLSLAALTLVPVIAATLALSGPAAAHDRTLVLPQPVPATPFTHGVRRLDLSREGILDLFRPNMRHAFPAGGATTWPLIPLPPLEVAPEAPPFPPLPRDLDGIFGMLSEHSVRLVFDCTVSGTPQELPDDIRIVNPYGFATPAGVVMDYAAPLGATGTVDLPALQPGESAYLLDVLPRGMAPGTACTAVER